VVRRHVDGAEVRVDPERVVITGLGVVASNAIGLTAFARALREGASGIRFHESLAALQFGCQVGGIPQGVEAIAPRYLAEDELLTMNSNMIYAAIAAIDAWADAGLERVGLEGEPDWDSGAIVGTGFGGLETVGKDLVPATDAGNVSLLGGAMAEQTMASGNTARIGGLLGLGNRVTTNSSACTTGIEAIVEALHRIRAGRAIRMLAGGSEGHSLYGWATLDALKVSPRAYNREPAKASRPMSASARGMVPSSGAGVLLLESLSSARRRGARIYAEVLAGEVNCGGQRGRGSMTAPNVEGARRCILRAVAEAGDAGRHIDVINGHLTATFADRHEIGSWSAALGLAPCADALHSGDQVHHRARSGRGRRHRVRRLRIATSPGVRPRLAQLRGSAPGPRRVRRLHRALDHRRRSESDREGELRIRGRQRMRPLSQVRGLKGRS
jgi:3-oxoacyl-(acyl-carrier-protein) synthase